MTYGLKEAHDELLSELEDLRAKYAEVCETSAMLRADMAAARERQAKLRDENAELRKLVVDMRLFILLASETEGVSIHAHGKPTLGMEAFERRMRELGIEVDG